MKSSGDRETETQSPNHRHLSDCQMYPLPRKIQEINWNSRKNSAQGRPNSFLRGENAKSRPVSARSQEIRKEHTPDDLFAPFAGMHEIAAVELIRFS